MFKKPLADLKTSAPLRSSDRRKLKQRIIESFSLQADIGDILVPDGLLSVKFSTHTNELGVAYLSPDGGDPLWFSLGKGSDDFIPTVYTLWKKPDLLPFLSTPSAVIPVLINGADLMAPGVVQHSSSLSPDRLVAVARYHAPVNGKPKVGPPLAVGRMAVSSDVLDRDENTKGKAVHILHTWKDHLWDMGTKIDPPGPRDLEVVDAEGGGYNQREEADEEEQTSIGTPLEGDTSADQPAEGDSTRPDGEEQGPKLTPQEVSALLRTTLIQSIMTTLSKLPPSSFPISATTFYTSYLLPCRPFDVTSTTATPVDIKHSAHKSLTAFLRSCSKEGLIKIKEGKGDVVITGVNASHTDVETHVPWRTVKGVETKKEQKEEREREEEEKRRAKDRELQITQLWKPHMGSVAWFKEINKDTTALYTQIEIRTLLNEYVTSRQLLNARDQSYVNLSADQVLSETLSSHGKNKKNGPQEIEFIKRDELSKRLLDKMQAWYEIRGEGKDTVVKKGQLKPISIVVKTRQGKRASTLITGFEPFFLDADMLSEDLRKTCACSTSVNPIAGKSAGQEVMVQGKQMNAVADLLLAQGVPKKWIETLDSTVVGSGSSSKGGKK